jgi:hypothetical protein
MDGGIELETIVVEGISVVYVVVKVIGGPGSVVGLVDGRIADWRIALLADLHTGKFGDVLGIKNGPLFHVAGSSDRGHYSCEFIMDTTLFPDLFRRKNGAPGIGALFGSSIFNDFSQEVGWEDTGYRNWCNHISSFPGKRVKLILVYAFIRTFSIPRFMSPAATAPCKFDILVGEKTIQERYNRRNLSFWRCACALIGIPIS